MELEWVFCFYSFGIPILGCSQGLQEGFGPCILTGLQALQPEVLRPLVRSSSGQQFWRKPGVQARRLRCGYTRRETGTLVQAYS